jgi:hypothetical protein
VIIPLIALRQDLLRRCEQWGIPFRRWPDSTILGQLHAVLFVDVNHVQRPEFEALLGFLHRHRRLDRLILKEAHLLLTASHYRERLPLITQLCRYSCPFVSLTIKEIPVPWRGSPVWKDVPIKLPRLIRVQRIFGRFKQNNSLFCRSYISGKWSSVTSILSCQFASV